jgi:RecA/RadA recombinase
MAKKVLNEGELPSIFDTIKKIDDTAEIIAESAYSNIKEWIPTGSYILNAAMSGDLFKAIPSGRVVTFSGTSSSGKSYLACSCCREAQKMGYTPIYMDSEGAIDSNFVKRLGVDPTKLIIKQVTTIAETSQFIANILGELQKQEEEYGQHQKIMFVLDSLGNLTSDKEMQDTKDGNNKRDMTKAQEIKALFRVNATALARTQTPLICVNHVYAAVGSYVPTNIQSGGSGIQYNSSLTIELSAAKLDDKDNDKAASQKQGADTTVKTGVLVTAKSVKSRFCRPYKVKFQIPYFKCPNPYVGLEAFMTWENSGVVRGNLIDEKAYNKLTDAAKEKIHVFDYNGQTMYCEEKETARGIVVRHLGCQVPLSDFFTVRVFTPEFLEYLNTNVIHPMFDLPDQSAFDDIKEIEDQIEVGTGPEE